VEVSKAHATQGVYGSLTPQERTALAIPLRTQPAVLACRWVWDLGRAGLVALGYFLSAKVSLAVVVQPEGLPPYGRRAAFRWPSWS
jgi:hypothetical protein